MRVARRVWLPLVALGVVACSSSSSSSAPASRIVGEWQTPIINTAATARWYFDTDGTCGELLVEGGAVTCNSSCTYTFDGTTLHQTMPSPSGGGTTTTTVVTVTFSGDDSSATFTSSGCDAGTCSSATYTRIDSRGTHTCP